MQIWLNITNKVGEKYKLTKKSEWDGMVWVRNHPIPSNSEFLVSEF